MAPGGGRRWLVLNGWQHENRFAMYSLVMHFWCSVAPEIILMFT